MTARLEEAGLRRYELCRAGFQYSVSDATWWRGRQLRLSDDQVDRLEPWPRYVARWMATRPHRERSAMTRSYETWGSTLAYERLGCRPRERFTFQEETGVFKGLAAAWGDLVQSFELTRIDRGAFRDTLAQQGAENIRLLWQHDTSLPVGKLLLAEETDIGLAITGRVSRIERRSDIMELARDGVLQLSIGFTPEDIAYSNDGPNGERVRHVRRLKLYEVSFVSWAASESADIHEVQGRHFSRAHQLAAAELARATALTARWPQPTPGPQRTIADRLYALAEAERLAIRAYLGPEQAPSPEQEYWRYVAQVKAQGRPIYADGSFPQASTAEAAYLAPLFAAVQRRRQAADNRRTQQLYEANAAYNAAVCRRTGYWHVEAWNH